MTRRRMLGVTFAAAALLAVAAPTAGAVTYNQVTPITIPTGPGDATPAASPINVSGLPPAATVQDIKVTLRGFTHTCPNDIGVLLQSPADVRPIELMANVGDCTDANNLTFNFDSTSAYMPDTGPLANGTYRATSYDETGLSYPQFGIGTAYAFPGPAASGNHTLASDFRGTPPDGTWNLIVRDFSSGDGGQFAGGWSLDITTGFPSANNSVPIPDGTTCTAYGAPADLSIPVSGLSGVVSDVGISMNILHTYVGDLDVQLLAPGGSPAGTVFSRIGSTAPGNNGDSSNLSGLYAFFDAAPDPPSWAEAVVDASTTDDIVDPGRYRPATPGETPNASVSTAISPAFAGRSPNGTWTLRVRDKCTTDTGTLFAAVLQVNTVPAPAAPVPPPAKKKKCKKPKKKKKGCKKKRKK